MVGEFHKCDMGVARLVSTEIPEWEDMPEKVMIASSSSWQNICITAYNRLERTPTKQKVRDLIDCISDRISNVNTGMFSDVLDSTMDQIVPEMLQEKKYEPALMTSEELRSKKYCQQCFEVVNTYWELWDHTTPEIRNAINSENTESFILYDKTEPLRIQEKVKKIVQDVKNGKQKGERQIDHSCRD